MATLPAIRILLQDAGPRRVLERSAGAAGDPNLAPSAAKLMRTFANQTEALGRYRGKGEQKMTVEHVHVYKGGQAIVGQVSQKNIGQLRRENTGGGDDEYK